MVGALAAAALPLVGGTAGAAEPPDTVYVARGSCLPTTQDGSWARPFCTIMAAAEIAQPGQTIIVRPGGYIEEVTIRRSGQPGKPIIFRGQLGPTGRVSVTTDRATATVTLAGVHDVTFEGFNVTNGLGPAAVLVDGSSNVTVTDGSIRSRAVGVAVAGASSQVTVSRTAIEGISSTPISVEAGASRTVIARNNLSVFRATAASSYGLGISVVDAADTVITGNTVVTQCLSGIDISGASPRLSLHNNIVQTSRQNNGQVGPCAVPDDAMPISVGAESAAGSFADYNLIDPRNAPALYSWAGTDYASLEDFQMATGHGAHDLATDPGLTSGRMFNVGYGLQPSSPAVDSAWADAPGATALDVAGNPHADDPQTTNTGTGVGYVDRGAVEAGIVMLDTTAGLTRVPGGGPYDVVATSANRTNIPTDGPVGSFHYRFDDGYEVSTRNRAVPRTMTGAGEHCVTTRASASSFRVGPWVESTPCTVVGAAYTSLTPTRVLDTRAAVGVPTTTPLGPNSTATLSLPSIAGVPAHQISAVVLNVTVTRPTKRGWLAVHPNGSSIPGVSNVNFEAGQTAPNLVTVPLVRGTNGKIYFYNGSGGTSHVVADLAGYYSAEGGRMKTTAPARVLDTRKAVGVPGTGPVGTGQRVEVDLSGRVPAGTTAAALNVTVTQPTKGGHVTAYPPGGVVPTASNLNFVPGQTVANMVIAPVVGGKVAFHSGAGGTLHLVADLAGYFAPEASGTGTGDTYVPAGPVRVQDTRTTSGAIRPQGTLRVRANPLYASCAAETCPLTSVLANITVTAPTAGGHLTAYPTASERPTASTLNFVPGQTVANLSSIRLGDGTFEIYNGSPGTVHVVVDQAGYFIGPA